MFKIVMKCTFVCAISCKGSHVVVCFDQQVSQILTCWVTLDVLSGWVTSR